MKRNISEARDMPLVSVVMSVYNGEEFLRYSIESIINQSFEDFEFIIVNDGSSDRSGEIIESYRDSRILYIKNESNKGLIESLNKGIGFSRGKYIARQDADDIALKNRLQKQVGYLENNADVWVLGCGLEMIDGEGKFISNWIHPTGCNVVRWNLLFNNCVAHSSSVFRRDVVEKIGVYDKQYRYAEDYELWSRVSRSHQVENLPEPLQKYRLHPDAVSSLRGSDQLKVQEKISWMNIKNELILSQSTDEFRVLLPQFKVGSVDDAVYYVSALLKLKKIFSENRDLSFVDSRHIDSYIVSCVLGLRERLTLLQSIHFMIKGRCFFPGIFWSKLAFIRFLLSQENKKIISRVLGRERKLVRR
ncbi:glycosyltransferase family 2 protein [Marinobacter sp. F4216]|uniref:glycosyltransferase family 2 protein n=1 Tax=Marinobacter sp. F4216 TaxID=2874281 RepID=UPI001CBD1064|nr:glycosyltransferase [Marinobacter sp. F4216]MBZ2167692.1 glycosyltransferase [Marinobacter sp. F4216]